MPDKLPSLRPERILRALEKCGLTKQRQTGSHIILTKPGLRRPVVIADHNREVSGRTLEKLLRQAEITNEEFLASL